jgi:hypothetical protein
MKHLAHAKADLVFGRDGQNTAHHVRWLPSFQVVPHPANMTNHWFG